MVFCLFRPRRPTGGRSPGVRFAPFLVSGSRMKLEKTRRHLLFWLVCIPFRSAYAALALVLGINNHDVLLRIQAGVAALQLFGFMRSLGKTVGGFGGPAWWASARPFHISLYAGFVVSASFAAWWAGLFLAADVILGAASWLTLRVTYTEAGGAPAALPLLAL